MKPPSWRIRSMCYPQGIGRLVTRPVWKPPLRMCEMSGCKNDIERTNYTWQGKQICWPCWTNRPGGYNSGYGYGHGTNYKPALPYEFTGNLNDSDYRLWVGSKMNYEKCAMCRRCREYCYSDFERKEHKEKFNPTCGRHLAEAYKVLLGKNPKRCVVCKLNCTTARWGVPLHNTPSCLNEWRYGRTQYTMLLLALKDVGGAMPEAAWNQHPRSGLYLPSGDGDGHLFTDLT